MPQANTPRKGARVKQPHGRYGQRSADNYSGQIDVQNCIKTLLADRAHRQEESVSRARANRYVEVFGMDARRLAQPPINQHRRHGTGKSHTKNWANGRSKARRIRSFFNLTKRTTGG